MTEGGLGMGVCMELGVLMLVGAAELVGAACVGLLRYSQHGW